MPLEPINLIIIVSSVITLICALYFIKATSLVDAWKVGLFFQTINFSGTVYYLNFNLQSHIVYFYAFLTSILGFVFGGLIGGFVVDKYFTKNKSYNLSDPKQFPALFWFILMTSFFVCIISFYKIGYIVLLEGSRSLLYGETVNNISELRLNSYISNNGRNYLAAGYVNQFKDTLLPLLSVILLSLGFKTGKPLYKYIGYFFIFVCCFFLLGNGQRAPFIINSLCICLFLILRSKKIVTFKTLGISVIVLLTFSFISIILGRSSMNNGNVVINLIEQLIWRIFGSNQWAGIYGFEHVIYPIGIVDGQDWIDSILGILPSHPGSLLSWEIAQQMWGGNGNAPATNVGTTYYNSGIIGCFIVFCLYAMYLQYITSCYYSNKRNSIVKDAFFSWKTIIVCTWIPGNFISYLLNGGFLAVVLLEFIYKITNKSCSKIDN